LDQVTVVTHIITPYQVEFLDAIRRRGMLDLRVIYLADSKSHRGWMHGDIGHPCIELAHAGERGLEDAKAWVQQSKLVIFGHYRHADALRWIYERHAMGRAWCFWGERPGFRFGGPAGRLFRAWKLRPLLMSRAPIWGIGQWAIDGYRREFGDKRRYFNIPYFSNLDRFCSDRSTSPGRRRILFSGSLIERKGVDLLARAFRDVARDNPAVSMAIVGDGNLRPMMEKDLAPVSDRVSFHGFKQWEDLPPFYRDADILCVPSRYDGWGLVVPEGLAAGLPVITTDKMGAAGDLIRDGTNGWIVQAGEEEALRDALRKATALSDAELAQKSTAARQSVASHKLSDGVRRFEEAVQGSLESWQAA
jgi:glycosyltransferase involved in cell wall biosynthesis